MTRAIRNQATFFLFGLAFWLPIGILIFIIAILYNNIEDIGRRILLLFLPERLFHPGFGIVVGIIIVYLSGIILKSTRISRVFSRIPVLGLFFGGGEIITIDRLLHMQPCLFQLSPTCLSYGWVLSEEQVKLGQEKAIFNLINVYYPNVPTLVTGQVFPVRKDTVIKLDNTSKEVIDLLLYAFRSPTDLKYVPWENESTEDFEKRAKSFGLNVNTEALPNNRHSN